MRIGSIQFKPEFGRISDNIERASKMIEDIDAELIVLPELCFTGYAFTSAEEARSMAESIEKGFSLKRMKEISERFGKGIIFGFPENDNGRLYNSCAFMRPGEKTEIYRKLHLYYFEKEWFLAGDNQLPVIEFRGCKVGLMICFDWYFPEVARTLALAGAHLLCHPSNLVMSHCQDSMITRCLENSIFAITANRIGREKRGNFDFKFTGRSQIISNKGEILYRASSDKEEVGAADIDFRLSDNKELNSRNDLWKDRRPEFYRMGNHGKI